MAKDIFGAGFLSPGDPTAPLYSQTFLDEMQRNQGQLSLEEQLRQAALGQIQIAQQNGNMSPELAQQGLDRIAQQSQQYQTQQSQYQAQLEQQRRGGLTPEQRAAEDNLSAQDARFGNDLSWLDPSFQYSPELLGQSAGSQAYADPNAIAYQNSAMQQAQQLANSNLSFMSGDQQQSIMNSILGVRAPQFQSDAQQQQALSAINAVNMPKFAGAGTQQDVLNRALGLASNTGPGALSFDNGARQQEQYKNLQGIIAGGGADAIEMARRQAARADSESWLRGQREADMADYAERGLTGSGMELLNLAADRQSAAQRNSAADLQTAAALEERRLGAINSAAGLATGMRGQTIDEQSLLNNRATAGLGVAGSLANSMRSADIQEQLGLTDAALQKAVAAGNLSSTMRGQTATEQLGLNNTLVNQYNAAGNIANTMRQQTATEQLGNRNAQLDALGTLASTANQARGQSAQEAQYRATSADDFSRFNQLAINQAKQDNTSFTQNAYRDMINNRTQTYLGELGLKTQAAISREAGNRADNNTGFNQGTELGAADAATFDAWLEKYRDQLMGIFQNSQNTIANATNAGNLAKGDIAAGGAGAAGTAIGAIIGGAGAGANAGGMTAAQGAAAGAQVGSQALTKAAPTTTTAEEEAARRRASLTGYASGGFG